MKRSAILLLCGLIPMGWAGRGGAAPLKEVGKVTASDGTLHEAFALDEAGNNLAFVQFTADGKVEMRIGPPGGNTRATDIAPFTSVPERILALGGHWFVVANEGGRRAAIVDGNGKIQRETAGFGDCEISYSPKALVTYSQKTDAAGTHTGVQVLRPDGSTLAERELVVTPQGTIDGNESLTFLGFTHSHLQALVQKPGSYNAKTDVRSPPVFATYDLLTRKTGSGKSPAKIDDFLAYVQRRAQKTDLDAVILLAAGPQGFELVGPGEKVRPLKLPVPEGDYDRSTLEQKQQGSSVLFSLLADRPGKESERFALAFFSLDPASAKVTAIGEVPLGNKREARWSAGGKKIAVLRQGSDGQNEIVVFAR
jgi:hypothetical protein